MAETLHQNQNENIDVHEYWILKTKKRNFSRINWHYRIMYPTTKRFSCKIP